MALNFIHVSEKPLFFICLKCLVLHSGLLTVDKNAKGLGMLSNVFRTHKVNK